MKDKTLPHSCSDHIIKLLSILSTMKDLVVYLDYLLSFDKQVSKVCKASHTILFVISVALDLKLQKPSPRLRVDLVLALATDCLLLVGTSALNLFCHPLLRHTLSQVHASSVLHYQAPRWNSMEIHVFIIISIFSFPLLVPLQKTSMVFSKSSFLSCIQQLESNIVASFVHLLI